MQGQLMRVDEAASVLGDRSGDRLAFSAWVEEVADPADAQEVPMDAIKELGEAFSEDLDDAFVDTGIYQSGDALEEVFVDALDAEDAGDYFARILRGVQLAARSPARFGIPPDLLRRFAGLLQRYRARRFDEMQAAEDLADQFAEEGTDEAVSLVGGLLARALARPSARRPPRPMSRPLRRQLVRNTRQAAQTLVRRQGPRAIRAMPAVVRSVQRTAIRQRTPVRTLPSAVRNVTNRVARTPALAQSLSRSRPLAGPPVSTATPRVLTYTTRDVIDKRISVPAQHSLVRLSKNPATSADAVGMLEEVKAGRLAGIYCVNWQVPAQRALRLGSNWWSVIPQGEDAVLMLDPDNLSAGQPLIAFRRDLDPDCGLLKDEKRFSSSPSRLDAALLPVWQSYLRLRRGELSLLCPPSDHSSSSKRSFPAAQGTLGQIRNIVPPCCPRLSGCPEGKLCHVNSRAANPVGTFSRSFVQRQKKSSVAIAYQNESDLMVFGSGTKIAPNVILTSAHVIDHFRQTNYQTFTESNLLVLFDYEYTAPSVDSEKPKIESFSTSSVLCVLESGDENCEDYALLVIINSSQNFIAKISNRWLAKNEEVIAFQHPMPFKSNPRDPDLRHEKPTHDKHVTRVSAGKVNPSATGCKTQASFAARPGSSGGGVFDKNGCLVGVIKGSPGTNPGNYISEFIQVKDILNRSTYLKKQFEEGVDGCITITTRDPLCWVSGA